jgi:hypothetical protein
MATELGSTLTMITYHMGVLVTYGTAKEAGLAAEGGGPTYESAVAKNPKVLALLNATETEDEGERAA